MNVGAVMSIVRMQGRWGRMQGLLYSSVVSAGAGSLYRRFVDEAVPPAPAGGLILDVGCGSGPVARLLAERQPECTVLGIDLSRQMISRALRATPRLPNLRFKIGDAQQLPLDDDVAHLVVSVASIKHWRDRRRGLAEIRRVLRPGSTAYILESDRECTLSAARRFVGYWRYVAPGTSTLLAAFFQMVVARQSPSLLEVTTMLQAVGLDVVDGQRLDELPFWTVRAKRPTGAAPE